MKRLSTLLVPSLLVLAACGSEDVENTPVDDIDEIVDADNEFDPMARDYELSEDAQARRDEFDQDRFESEYSGYRDDIRSERDTQESMAAERERSGGGSGNMSGGSAGSNGSDSSSSGSGSSDGGMDMPQRDQNTNMRARSDMSWSYLDRNDDGKLSVAEYAIWAIPLDPTEPEPNDERPPFVEQEEINKAADSFFYYDRDGDTYLDQREFTSARRGEAFEN